MVHKSAVLTVLYYVSIHLKAPISTCRRGSRPGEGERIVIFFLSSLTSDLEKAKELAIRYKHIEKVTNLELTYR